MRHLELAVKRAPELLSAHLIDAKGERKHRKRKIQSEREGGRASEDGRLINMREDGDLTGKKVKAEYFKRASSS